MAKAKQTPAAATVAAQFRAELTKTPLTPATLFPTAEEIHATTQAVLNAPPKGVNWEGFDSELTRAFQLTKEAEDSLRTLAGKMYQCGFRFAMLNNDKGEMDDKTPHYVELRKRLTTRLDSTEQALLSMDRWNAATLDAVERGIRTAARKRLNTMMSDIRNHLKTVEEIQTSREVKTLEKKIYDKLTEVREMIVNADPDKVKFDIDETKDLVTELRSHFDI